jgi:hypothetical protein
MSRMHNRWIAVAAALVLAIGAGLWFSQTPRRPALDPPAVVAQIQQMNQLATVKYTVQKVVGLREDTVPVGSESILLIMQATVQAGIDLARLQERDVTFRSDGTVVLRLPPAQVLGVAVDEKETKVWDRQKTWWTPWIPYSKDLEQRARVSGLESIKQAALDMQILKQAERNAETSIRALLSLAGAKSVVIIPAGVS